MKKRINIFSEERITNIQKEKKKRKKNKKNTRRMHNNEYERRN